MGSLREVRLKPDATLVARQTLPIADGMPRGGRLRPCRAHRIAGNRPERFTLRVFRHRVRVVSNHLGTIRAAQRMPLRVSHYADIESVRDVGRFPGMGVATATRYAFSGRLLTADTTPVARAVRLPPSRFAATAPKKGGRFVYTVNT